MQEMAGIRTVVKKLVPRGLFRVIEPYGHLGEALIAQTASGFPGKGLKIIGVTGTDGKTSTVSYIAQLLRHSGQQVAFITTVETDYGDGKGPVQNDTRLTTSGALQLTKSLKRIKQNGVEWLVLETSSHSLAQHRVWSLPYTVAVLTNLSPEHLDYHQTFEKYRAVKVGLFRQTNRNRKGLRLGVINADDKNAAYFTKAIKNPLTYGINKGDLRAKNVKTTPVGSGYMAVIGQDTYDIKINIPGGFNVYNSLAAVAVGRAVGLDKKQIETGIAAVKGVAGRMTAVDEGQDFAVIVDYAHTPDSFEKLFKEIKPVTKGRIISVFGSAGRRDVAKRPLQGQVAGKYSDIVIITEEDDRDMDGQEIMAEIAAGAKNSGKTEGKDLFLVHKREEAIGKAIGLAKAGDSVLLLGKGHEGSILGNGPKAAELRTLQQDDNDPRRVAKRSYDEVEVAKKAIKNL